MKSQENDDSLEQLQLKAELRSLVDTLLKGPDYLKPSYVKAKRDALTRLWKTIIMDKEGVEIKKFMYAAKHTGADAKILAGISIDALQDMYGHSSKLMTKKYITKLKEVYHKEVIQKSTDF